MRLFSRGNKREEKQKRSDGDGGVGQKGLTGRARNAELTLLLHPALLGGVVNMGCRHSPETKEMEENNSNR
jgi:hypothetical protein